MKIESLRQTRTRRTNEQTDEDCDFLSSCRSQKHLFEPECLYPCIPRTLRQMVNILSTCQTCDDLSKHFTFLLFSNLGNIFITRMRSSFSLHCVEESERCERPEKLSINHKFNEQTYIDHSFTCPALHISPGPPLT